MQEEIKEILEFDFESQGERIEINEYERNILKDYITNLQKENEKLKQIIKDNTILVKDENGNYQECNINPLDYKSRNEKAIKYIEQEAVFYDSYDGEDTMLEELCERYYKELLNILQGVDKE